MNRYIKIGNRMRRRIFVPAGILAALACLWLFGMTARADDVQVSASLSDSGADVGQSVDFTITVDGETEAAVPQNIDVDGLTITYERPSVQTSVSFGTGFGSGSHVQRSVVHTYSVVPQRGGDFTIPAQQVTVDGKSYTTQPVSLKVGGGGSASQGGGADNGSDQPEGGGKLYYAELVLPSSTAYIGEAVPVEIRLFVDERVRAQLEESPEITAQGCTVQKVGKPDQSEVTRNGREYVMVVYKTALTPAQTGRLTLGPVSVQALAQMPETRRHRASGGPFDDPMFQNPFFDDAFRMMSPPQQIVIKSDPVTLNALPLPAQGQPRSFAGAVGNFSMTSSVSPSMVEAGDPIKVTVKIQGRGDFDRVTAPLITDADGWRTYPPSSHFEGDDDIGLSGAKTFEMAVIPQTKKERSPTLEWSYFDPIKEQYETLTDKGWPIKVEGEPPVQTAPVVAQQTPAPAPAGPDIIYIRADSAGWGETFEPLYMSRLFWAAQGVPLAALLAFAGVQVARRRAADERARLLGRLRREKETEIAAMQRRDVPESELYQHAARALRLEAAMQTGRTPDTLDGTEVLNARALDDATAGRVRRVFERCEEALYAGASSARSAASPEARVELLETVKGYENAKPLA